MALMGVRRALIKPQPIVAVSAFTPLSLPNLVGWWKADTQVYSDNGVTPAANNATIQLWKDQSGNSNDLSQATAAQRPTFKSASALNSNPGVFLDSTANGNFGASLANAAFPMTATTTASLFMVVRGSSTVPPNGYLAVYYTGINSPQNDGRNGAFFERIGTTDVVQWVRGNVGGTGFTMAQNTNIRIGTIWDGVNGAEWLNGVTTTPVSEAGFNQGQTFVSPGSLTFGTQPSGAGAAWDGVVCEIVLCIAALNTTQIASLDAYFRTKWGI